MRTEALGARVAVAFLPLQVGPGTGLPAPSVGALASWPDCCFFADVDGAAVADPAVGAPGSRGDEISLTRDLWSVWAMVSVIETSSRFRPELSRWEAAAFSELLSLFLPTPVPIHPPLPPPPPLSTPGQFRRDPWGLPGPGEQSAPAPPAQRRV
ncbi:PREDICTED: uncharacterized protein LOC107182813 isoform X2 [Myotis davidii]|uniref:uncharacterized protein LOC107182813 isoform X2 n=1 Tax=Myotis davidii TaxID=225400 RepID=UPI00076720C1|nr:PREDICTED: uncharacterized protein LOC107182813 isoform X2 [Myotis davidii]